MDERILKFRIGVMVIASLFIAAILIVLFGEAPSGWFHGSYTVYVHFPTAPGVTQDTPVRKSGILIGRVTDVRFADEAPAFADEVGVIVTLNIRSDVKLRRNEVCRITGSLLGDAVLQFVPTGDQTASTELIQSGDYLEGTVASNPLQVLANLEGDLGQAIGSVSTAGNEIGRLAQNLNNVLASNGDQINRIITKAERALDGFERTLKNVNDVLGDETLGEVFQEEFDSQDELAQLEPVEEPLPGGTPRPSPVPPRERVTIPELLRETRDAVRDMREAVSNANRNLANLERFTEPLGERGEGVVVKVDQAVTRLDELLAEIVEFSRVLNRREGTLGQLVNNPELYQNLNSAACNLEQLTRELKPIVRDARVFTDKIARHPELLGVRGAIQKSPGIK